MLKGLKALVRTTLGYLRLASGRQSFKCCLCGYQGRFFAFASPPRLNALCPKCGSLERHRLLVLANEKFNLFADKNILHFAPEKTTNRYIKSHRPRNYVTADLFAKDVDMKQNIESLTIPDQSFDTVLCSHVLEHVDDRKALQEINRILINGGMAILMVPLIEGWDKTYENHAIQTAQERATHFGRWDHVRYYGRDFRDRVSEAGFSIHEFTAIEPAVSEYGLMRGEKVFMCKKLG